MQNGGLMAGFFKKGKKGVYAPLFTTGTAPMSRYCPVAREYSGQVTFIPPFGSPVFANRVQVLMRFSETVPVTGSIFGRARKNRIVSLPWNAP